MLVITLMESIIMKSIVIKSDIISFAVKTGRFMILKNSKLNCLFYCCYNSEFHDIYMSESLTHSKRLGLQFQNTYHNCYKKIFDNYYMFNGKAFFYVKDV
jgi:hypothetical protein